ncbi:MAG: hypothetical protein ABJO88_13780, partial [Parasphingorhabdus sp.]
MRGHGAKHRLHYQCQYQRNGYTTRFGITNWTLRLDIRVEEFLIYQLRYDAPRASTADPKPNNRPP